MSCEPDGLVGAGSAWKAASEPFAKQGSLLFSKYTMFIAVANV